MSLKKRDVPSHLLWLDMEMTGLDVEKERPIEVAAIITDTKFVEVSRFHAVIFQPQSLLEKMDDWNRTHHGKSGLLKQIPMGKSMDVVDQELAQMIDDVFHGERAILAGNSIGQDKLFIDRYFLKTAERIHYRTLDVSSWKVVFQTLYGEFYDKKESHRATDDILESIQELKHYLEFVKAP
ncbi:MAG TPA: oligoribonuclease [Bdellovibrionales bacterium]|nr:oligoribonuclease [Pseudobdellovibrionaceae bacterium]HAG91697.1 oligoribonuclease [Bdellovibrionales bacterium]|tara:strand:- start:316 stop:858 length:543 start_codon:yes stop_codon:yes gene_type:complete